MERVQTNLILHDLAKKIVFLVGPRQVGKTWLAHHIAKQFQRPAYFNYDNFEDRQIIHKASWSTTTDLIIFDELHKMPQWKNYLKGIFDTKPDHLRILVTGSARLDTFRQAGDSLAGRFFIHHLLPFSPAEVPSTDSRNSIERFMERGGFPEPFLNDNAIEAKRWRQQYIDGLIRYDVEDIEHIHDLRAMQMLVELLRHQVGSLISVSSIARDIALSPMTVAKYIQILEALYIIFRVTPYSRNIARAVLKSPKLYFYDTGLVLGDDGAKFENAVAIALLKYVYSQRDYQAENIHLQYLRNKEGKEIDFCLVRNDAITMAIETKLSDSSPSDQLQYFCHKYQLPGIQLVKNLRHEQTIGTINIRLAENYLRTLHI